MNNLIKTAIESAEINKMLSATRLLNLYHLLSQVICFGVPGDIIEIGCNEGFSARFMRMVMDCHGCKRKFHVYDSFEGISEPSAGDAGIPDCIHKGYLNSTETVLIEKFNQFGLQPPIIHKGWVRDTLHDGLPGIIAFAHIDIDLYEPIMDSLKMIYEKCSNNAIILVDDYGHPDWPGAKKAVNDFASLIPEPLNDLDFHNQITAQYQAYFRKKREFKRRFLQSGQCF